MKIFLLLCACLLVLGASAQSTWYPISTGTTKKLNAVDFPSETIGYIGGNDSLLLKTTDGGQTWNPVNYSGVTFYPGEEHIINLEFTSANVGYMTTGPYGGAYKTLDGGSSWTPLTLSGTLCYTEGLYFFDEQNGFIGGSGCFQGELIEKMTAGVISSATINTTTLDADNRVVDVDFYNTSFGLAVSRSGYILRTADGGSNWDTIPSGLSPGVPLTSVAIMNDTLAYAGYNDLGAGFGILMTTDGGATWNMDMSSATFWYPAFLSLHKSGEGIIYCGAQPSTGNEGLIFEDWSASIVDHPINDLNSYGDSVVFGVGDSGYVVVNQPLNQLGIEKNKIEKSTFEIYPNPANDELFIRSQTFLSDAEIILTSISGEVVYHQKYACNTIAVESLPAGIYILQLINGSVSETQRFVKN